MGESRGTCRGSRSPRSGWPSIPFAVATVIAGLSTTACGSIADPAAGAATILAEEIATHTRELSDDRFEGRGPASRGEEAALEYLQGAYTSYGLLPMGDVDDDGTRGFLQRVPAMGITASPQTASMLVPASPAAARRGELQPLSYGEDFVTWTRHEEPTTDVTAPLVFVGYGVVAPEEEWDDFKGRDLSGSILVMLVNDPPVDGKFGDRAMTYYGRWTYKLEEAARRGAAGALLVHTTESAGYGWNVVVSSWSGEQFNLPPAPDQAAPVLVEGWISQRAAAAIFTSAGHSLPELVAAAATPEFEPVDLQVAASLHLDNDLRRISSHNVIGAVAGSDDGVADEYVIFTAHWDHLGYDPSIDGDGIFNGALDNASGTASMLEIAQAYASLEPATRRSVMFIATTLEEQGLLGSQYYTTHPVVPLDKTLAVINIDGNNLWGPTEDITVIGLGNSTLDEILLGLLEADGRSLTPDAEPEKGFFYRSDHFPFAKVGVPALYVDTGVRFIDRPPDFARLVRDQYTRLNYHQPSDEFDEAWDFSGAETDTRALFRVGFEVAQGETWPSWNDGTEFKAVREAMLGR